SPEGGYRGSLGVPDLQRSAVDTAELEKHSLAPHWLALVECRPICQKLAHRPKRAQSGLLIEAQSGQMARRSADRFNVCHLVPNCGASFALIRQFIHCSIDRRYSYALLLIPRHFDAVAARLVAMRRRDKSE